MHADIVRKDIKGGFDESNPYKKKRLAVITQVLQV
jgi:hypothetical protein